MSEIGRNPAEEEHEDEELAVEESEAAAAEAGEIGGPTPEYGVEDDAERPVAEGGEGEAEGFELAEEELADVASHGDQKRFPNRDAPPPEEPSGTIYGEPDQAIPDDE
jgi:hypothetical protein